MRFWPFGSHQAARVEIQPEFKIAEPTGTPAEISCNFCMVPKGYGCINVLGKLYGTLLTYPDGKIDFHLTRKKDWEHEKFKASIGTNSAAATIDEGDSSLSYDT